LPETAVRCLDFPSLVVQYVAMATEETRVIGTRIKRARQRLRWSQAQLADAVDVDVKTVRNWERTGRVRNRQGAIEEVLGISLDIDEQDGPAVTAASGDPAEALDGMQRELDRLRRALREQQEGKGQANAIGRQFRAV